MLLALLSLAGCVWGQLPQGVAPEPVPFPHFPDRMHAFVWRNWELVPAERLAAVLGATSDQVRAVGLAMGLPDRPPLSEALCRRCYITIIRRNWHLLPYEQLLQLLGWDEAQLAYTLREDDFLWARQREAAIRAVVERYFPGGLRDRPEGLFAFLDELSAPAPTAPAAEAAPSHFSPRYCYSYFALYGDPLLTPELDPYPEGYLERLAGVGVNGVWLQAVLYKLTPFPWAPELSAGWEQRLRALRTLAQRARRHGVGVYLYLNEPRAMPLSFFDMHPDLKGTVEGDHAAVCTSVPAVQEYLVGAVERIFREVPELAGLFTITASENFTNCWSHYHGAECPRCSQRTGAAVLAEVNGLFERGVRQAGSQADVIAWDWGWPDDWAEATINALPSDVALQSVSEWSLPIVRGGVASTVGEYSISAVGPGPRATRHWALARQRGLRTIAKVQAGNTWELSATPYIPALNLVAQHMANLRAAGVDGLMLGWTLGGYPSPNLEVAAVIGRQTDPDPRAALREVAQRRFGPRCAGDVLRAWRDFSRAFAQFPYHSGMVYFAPMQVGPANLLWERPTGYGATMVGFPYDDLPAWCAAYPPEVLAQQFEAVCAGWEPGLARLERALAQAPPAFRPAVERELSVARAAYLHFRSCANQTRFVMARNALAAATTEERRASLVRELDRLLGEEIGTAGELYALQTRDSRLGFEATNQYYYVPLDLVEKVVCCEDLRERWLGLQPSG